MRGREAEHMRHLFKTCPQPITDHDLIPFGDWLRAPPTTPSRLSLAPWTTPSRPYAPPVGVASAAGSPFSQPSPSLLFCQSPDRPLPRGPNGS
jgi:hypothetical protein